MSAIKRIEFTREMKKDYTILVPSMLPIHFELIICILRKHGYKIEMLTDCGRNVIDTGLKYVHNDTCYPALCVIGQYISALDSGRYDPHKTALMITQTGGGCRASNYIHLLRKALEKSGYGYMPVISLNLSGLERNSGFTLTLPILRQMIASVAYGDLIMLLNNQVEPYEINKGDCARTISEWIQRLSELFMQGKALSGKAAREQFDLITDDFASIPVKRIPKVRVGVVGEIYVKYSPLANNDLYNFLLSQDCEAMIPGLMGFCLFKCDNRLEDIKLYGGSSLKKAVVKILINYLKTFEDLLIESVKRYPVFTTPAPYNDMKKAIDGIIGYGAKMGEGWLLTAEMLELIDCGYENIVCAQPFGCLPNHIVGKGMIRSLCERRSQANIVPIDYDPGAARVNQENRIKLMLAVARERLPQSK